tara:strand:+ start:491 stop:961 length:471 start_codon:yes stop_codon:yes gene_type:complete
MKITKAQLKQIIKEELSLVLELTADHMAPPMPSVNTSELPSREDLSRFGAYAGEEGAQYAALAAIDKATRRSARRKLAMHGIGRFVPGALAADAGIAAADYAIDAGAGGIESKIGRERVMKGEEAAYNLWADDRIETTDKIPPTYEQYLVLRDWDK